MTGVREQILDRAKSRVVAANGLRHRVLTFAGGERELVFVPGITSPAETAEFLAEALPEFTVHVPDLRGRGRTDRPPAGAYTMNHYRKDLAGVIASLELDDPIVVGHSLGARIVADWTASESWTGAPVVLVDPPLSGPGRPYPMSARSFARQLSEAREGTTAENVRQYFPAWPERELRLRAELLHECDETAVLETHRGFEEEEFLPTWARVRGCLGLIRGGNSPVVTPDDVAELERRNPGVPVIGVADAGHMVPWDNLPGFVVALRSLVTDETDENHSHERTAP